MNYLVTPVIPRVNIGCNPCLLCLSTQEQILCLCTTLLSMILYLITCLSNQNTTCYKNYVYFSWVLIKWIPQGSSLYPQLFLLFIIFENKFGQDKVQTFSVFSLCLNYTVVRILSEYWNIRLQNTTHHYILDFPKDIAQLTSQTLKQSYNLTCHTSCSFS